MTVGERLRIVRKDLRLSQGEVGKAIGITASRVSQLELDQYQINERTLKDLCKTFSISREWLIDGVGDMYTKSESKEQLVLSFAELIEEYPAVYEMAKLASKHMTADDWKRINELLGQIGG